MERAVIMWPWTGDFLMGSLILPPTQRSHFFDSFMVIGDSILSPPFLAILTRQKQRDMERESLEEDGLSTSSLLLKEVSNCGNHSNSTSSSDSSVTALLVFSTLVAVCGSIATGCAVSIGVAPTTQCIRKQLISHHLTLWRLCFLCNVSSVHHHQDAFSWTTV